MRINCTIQFDLQFTNGSVCEMVLGQESRHRLFIAHPQGSAYSVFGIVQGEK
jgi:hypothetical protein